LLVVFPNGNTQRRQTRSHRGHDETALFVQVVALTRIVLEVVQFGARRAHTFKAAIAQRPQFAPAKTSRIQGLRIGLVIEVSNVSFHQGTQADTVAAWRRIAEDIQDRRHHIDQSHEIRHPLRPQTWNSYQQRHVVVL
jgi:Asp-tRNA(Asn)/Glu-tRNA(Gln) amidotransferase A subunit family amidase